MPENTVQSSEEAKGFGVLERASFTLAIASLPQKDRYAAFGAMYKAMVNSPADIPTPKPNTTKSAWWKNAIASLSGTYLPKVAASSPTSYPIDFASIQANYPGIDLSGSKKELERYIRTAFCVHLGLPEGSPAVTVEDRIFELMGQPYNDFIYARVERVAACFFDCFANPTSQLKDASMSYSTDARYAQVMRAFDMTHTSLLDVMPFICWLVENNFGSRLQQLCAHDPFFVGCQPDQRTQDANFILSDGCGEAVRKAKANREDYARQGAHKHDVEASKQSHEADLAHYTQIAGNYEPMVKAEKGAIATETELIAKEDGLRSENQAKLTQESETLRRIQDENARTLAPYESEEARTADDEYRAQENFNQVCARVNSAESKLSSAEGALSGAQSEIEELESRNRSIDSEMSRLQSDIDSGSGYAQSTYDQYAAEYEDQMNQLDQLESEQDRLQQEYDEALEEYRVERHSADPNEALAERLYERSARLKDELHAATNECTAMRNAANNTKLRVDNAERELQQFEQKEREIARLQGEADANESRIESLESRIASLEQDIEGAQAELYEAQDDQEEARAELDECIDEHNQAAGELSRVKKDCDAKEAAQQRIVDGFASAVRQHSNNKQAAETRRSRHQATLDDIEFVYAHKETLIPDTEKTIADEGAEIVATQARMDALTEDNKAQNVAFDEAFKACVDTYMNRAQQFRAQLSVDFGGSLLGEPVEVLSPNEATILLSTPLESYNKLENDLFRKLQSEELPEYPSALEVYAYELPAESLIRAFLKGAYVPLFDVAVVPPLDGPEQAWIANASATQNYELDFTPVGAAKVYPVVLRMNEGAEGASGPAIVKA